MCDFRYDLCGNCFQNEFPEHHKHPRESFVKRCIIEHLEEDPSCTTLLLIYIMILTDN